MSALLIAAILSTGLTGIAHAQGAMPSVTIGRIASQKSCKVYEESAGRSATVATPYAYASAESWRTWLVKDCVNNFATIRTSLEAALASSGKFVVKPGGRYTLTGAISAIGGDPDATPGGARPGDAVSVSSTGIFVNMEVTLKDASGRIVYGGLLTKRLETGSSITTPGLHTASSMTGEGVYTTLQNQVALAVARLVAFHIIPLTVTAVEDQQIRLNYGAPLLTLGTVVHVTPPGAMRTIRYAVTSSEASGAIADKDNEANAAGVAPGMPATVLEAEDPAMNERRMNRVDLP